MMGNEQNPIEATVTYTLDGDLKTSQLRPGQAFDRTKLINWSRGSYPAFEEDKEAEKQKNILLMKLFVRVFRMVGR